VKANIKVQSMIAYLENSLLDPKVAILAKQIMT
jgi:hypothetical protein